jgi:hypothetical protein
MVVVSNALAVCRLDSADFAKYIEAKQRVAQWLLASLAKQQDSFMVLTEARWRQGIRGDQVLNSFGEFENYLRSRRDQGFSSSQSSNFGLKKGLPFVLVKDLIFTTRIEELVPDIKLAEVNCSGANNKTAIAKTCSDTVKLILKKFNLSGKNEEQGSADKNTLSCDF